jgi:hypothetical protein
MKIMNMSTSKISYLIPLLFVLLSNNALADRKPKDCLYKDNTICQKLVTLRPRLDHKKAYKLSNHFHRIAKKYQIRPDLLISIAFQESAFNLNVVRKISGLIYDEVAATFKEVKLGADFCMMQIHASNIKKLKLDAKKLLSDPAYCIESGAKILATYKEEHSKTNKKWWAYYNAIHIDKREIYYKQVSRHLKKLSVNHPERAIASK